MLRVLCREDPIPENVRYSVPFGNLDWTVDVCMGALAGAVFAEVELEDTKRHVQLPRWVGEEVTNHPWFKKVPTSCTQVYDCKCTVYARDSGLARDSTESKVLGESRLQNRESRFITFVQAATKSFTVPPWLAAA